MAEEQKPTAPTAPTGVPEQGKAAKPAAPVEKKKEKRGKKPHKNKPASQKWKKYKIEGDKITRAKVCPRCGPGTFLMEAKDRLYCGKCHLTEFLGKEKPVDENKEKPAPTGVPEQGIDAESESKEKAPEKKE